MNRIRARTASSSEWEPLSFATLDLDFAADRYRVGNAYYRSIADLITATGATFTRASSKWVRNSAGVLTQFTSNEPAREWVNGEAAGVSIELGRTNLFLNSFTPATQSITVTNGTTYTVSRGGGSGTVVLSSALTGTVTEATPISGAASGTTLTVTVTGTVEYVQVELGAFPTSPISTAGSSVARQLDVFSIPVNASWYTQGPGTILFRGRQPVPNAAGGRYPFHLNDGTANNVVYQSVVSGSTLLASVIAIGGASTSPGNLSNVSRSTLFKTAIAYASGASQGISAANGTLSTAVTPGTPPLMTTLSIGSNGTANTFNGTIARIAYGNSRVANADLQALTL
jgi:hypothetical protein